MNISYNWLKDVITIDIPAEKLAEQLTRVGLAVEGIHPHGEDFVLDIDLTSNRPDCLSHLGIAREIHVITGSPITSIKSVNLPHEAKSELVTIRDPELCSRFTARVIRNVKISPSPDWLVARLEAVGERSINNVADITNYVMLELGQPMHAFDLDRLVGSRIVVRRAKSGESIQTLDEVSRKLDPEILAICDAGRPVAIGGVMGGFESSITNATKNVLLEVAYFQRQSIRHTSRKLGLATDASYRFERGVDIERLVDASNRATELICELTGGTPDEFVDVYPEKITPNIIESGDISAAVRRLTGLGINTEKCVSILTALGIKNDGSNQIFVSPTWRHDIAIEEDLVEEVTRHVGYENIGTELPPAFGAGEYQSTEVRKKLLRQSLVDMGFDEAISYSFIDTSFDDVFEPVSGTIDPKSNEKFVTLRDAVIEGAVRMRPTLLPGLMDAIRLNLNHRRRDLKLFELGKVFAARAAEDPLPTEKELLAIAVTGGELLENKANPVKETDFFDAKGALEAALDAIGISDATFRPASVKHLRNGQAATVSLHGSEIGFIGRLSDAVAASYKFRQPVFVGEIDIQTALQMAARTVTYKPLSRFPSITRDVSLLADRSVAYDDIKDAIEAQGRDICRSVTFVDVFEGKGLGSNERSITLRLEYRSDERTLVESEVDDVHAKLIAELEEKTGVKQRF
jgi:phenylalanyl-tRNA synthetase beta chain